MRGTRAARRDSVLKGKHEVDVKLVYCKYDETAAQFRLHMLSLQIYWTDRVPAVAGLFLGFLD